MPLRPLTAIEQVRAARLAQASIDFSLFQPTATGLRKSILDATFPVRCFLQEHGLHDYQHQRCGPAFKVMHDALLIHEDTTQRAKASLYRPQTKSGDPRFWFRGLRDIAQPDDIMALTAHNSRLIVFNLTRLDVVSVLNETQSGPLWNVLTAIQTATQSVADELLGKLRALARRGPLPSVMNRRADTAIGRTLESALGIPINSSPMPDYKGIELKSYRRRRASKSTRKTLFAKVPSWKISQFGSSRQIVETFGYPRGQDLKLYCTVSTQQPNSQGLSLSIDARNGLLHEVSDRPEIGAFATWSLHDLRQTLMQKHNETFWVGATVQRIDGREHFCLTEVLHTRNPIGAQFDLLLANGAITVDHLIKKQPSGRVAEKGPLFKISPESLEQLFPPSVRHTLI